MVSNFKKRFQTALEVRGLTQADIARITGWSTAKISHYYNGRNKPNRDAVSKLAQALKVDEAWLLGYDTPATVQSSEWSLTSDFVSRFHEAMELRGMTPRDISLGTSLQRQRIYDFYNNKDEPNKNELATLARALQVDYGWLCGFNVPMIPKEVGKIDRLFKLVRDKGFTLPEFAQKIGVTVDSMLMWSERNFPHNLKAIYDVLDTNTLYLITGEEPDDYIWSRISNIFLGLNIEGRKKLLERAEELDGMPKYTEENTSHNPD